MEARHTAATERSLPPKVVSWPARQNAAENPYNRLLTDALVELGVEVEEFEPRTVLFGDARLWHIHWPERFFSARRTSWLKASLKSLATLLLIIVARIRGMRVVWTVHNLRSHEGRFRRTEALFWWAFTRLVHGTIALAPSGARAASAAYPVLGERPIHVIPIGHYGAIYGPRGARDTARERLGRSGAVILYFGYIRPYKNVPGLVRCFRALADPDVSLVIAGNCADATLRGEIDALCAPDHRVLPMLRFIPDAEVSSLFAACDLVVLPFSEILNSSSAVLALTMERPVLVPNVGALGDLADVVGSQWVRTYDGALTPAVLSDALRWARDVKDSAPDLRPLSWPTIARATADFYEAIARRGG